MIETLEKEVTFTFSRASGKGGQNVNKLNTKANLSWNIYNTKLITYREKENFKSKYPNSIKEGGVVLVTSSLHRTQKLNKDECLRKLMKMISKAKEFKKVRVKTRPTRSSQEKRIKEKKSKGQTKKLRQEKF